MSKGIIVVDVPEYCDYCSVGRMFGYDSGVECLAAPEGNCVSGYGFHIKKPDWCPIQPMLEKIPHSEGEPWAEGWNSCIDELLKGGKQMKRLTAKRVNGIKKGY